MPNVTLHGIRSLWHPFRRSSPESSLLFLTAPAGGFVLDPCDLPGQHGGHFPICRRPFLVSW